MKKNKNSIKLAMLWVLSFIIIILMMNFKSHAADVSGPQLPIVVENTVNLEVYQNYINSNYGGFWDLSQDNVIGWGSLEQGRIWSQTFAIPQVPDQVQDYLTFSPISVNTYPNFDYNNNTLTLTFSNLANTNNKPWRLITFNTVTTSDTTVEHVDSVQFNVTSTINRGVYGNTGNVINYISSDIYLTNNGAWVVDMPVFVDELPVTPAEIGTAIVPPAPILPEYPAGSNAPTQVPPTYTPTDYQWTTPPAFDGSTLENAISSLNDRVKWLADNLHLELKNLTDNGKHFVEYIGKTLQYYGNAILQTLNNFIQNFYDNMKNLIEPIYTKISEFADLFINPFDEEEFENQIDNCQLITQYNELLENCEVLQQIFNETSEPDSFILYIDFEDPFADSEHKIIHGEINFNWLVPLRPVYRPFLQVFVLIECFVGGFRILGNIIGGKAK